MDYKTMGHYVAQHTNNEDIFCVLCAFLWLIVLTFCGLLE